ncbi:uncharacterized mitochondrial protein AtMg01250-like [Vicia villosa]|uniref:uncharacterized mitochondrial protein AtMg01250-like n=1 Tax=Vicia villosa TaxID=3911 RepID=UPI00273CD55E|nr:uncharacterized mitochondrial protein AtMg01250-like [Vicia villosa]
MDACVFTSYMTMIVNGNNTKDFKVERGLRQDDPLSPFLFVILMEGLTRLMEKAVDLGVYRGFNYGENYYVHILQFANDTIIFRDGSNDNLWGFKAILRGFKLMTGLKINMCKSNIYGINLSDGILSMASSFLTCGIRAIPFKFLGVKVGDSPMKVAIWRDVIKNVSSRLSKWSAKFLSLGGRVVLINSILNMRMIQ